MQILSIPSHQQTMMAIEARFSNCLFGYNTVGTIAPLPALPGPYIHSSVEQPTLLRVRPMANAPLCSVHFLDSSALFTSSPYMHLQHSKPLLAYFEWLLEIRVLLAVVVLLVLLAACVESGCKESK